MRLKEIKTLEKKRKEEKERVEKQRRMQGHHTGDSGDDVGHISDPSEEAEDNELDWLTELSEIKPKCAGCSFLAKQVYQLQKELKELNEKCHRSKVIYTSTWVPPILSSYQMSCLQNYRQLFMGTHWLSFLTLVMTLSVPRKLFDLRCCNISCIAFQEYSGCIALSYLRT